MTSVFTGSFVEDAALGWLEALEYAVLHGPAVAAGEPAAPRSDPRYRDAVLEGRLRQVQQHGAEPKNLAILRYMLRPKLVSGELRVKDAEQLQESQP